MLEAKEVVKSFDGFRALDSATLTVPKGTVYGLVGPNGAGKSTIIRHFTGVYRPDSGKLLLEGAPKKSKPAPSPSAATLNTVSRASSELDIRGYETLEAESVVENYLDSAVMAKLGTVTIIHGKGTGALRKAVHEILKRNKAVKSFRLGRYGEGEAGVTVVELK